MPGNLSARRAAAHRQGLLRRTRVISLGIAGGAAVASLALGTAFAHAIPGQARTAGTQSPPAAGAPASAPSSPAPQSGSAQPGRSGPPARRHVRRPIAPPPQPPASTPAPPQVSSGGS